MKKYNVQWIDQNNNFHVRTVNAESDLEAKQKLLKKPPKTFDMIISATLIQSSSNSGLTKMREEFAQEVMPDLAGISNHGVLNAWDVFLQEMKNEGNISPEQYKLYKKLSPQIPVD